MTDVPGGLLGFRGDPKWRDMSDYLVHFTSRESLLSILNDLRIEGRNQFGWFRTDNATANLRMSACFSEVPIDQIDRLAARRGRYGIGFRRTFVQSKGGGRVWYAEELQRELLFDAFKHIYRTDPARINPLWKLTPFFDGISPAYDFAWEREWRVPGGLSFELSQVAFLVRPRVSDAGNEFLEHPAPCVPLLTSEAMEFWEEAFEALGGPEDKYVAAVLEKFADPNNHLAWDSEERDYFWTTVRYSAEDAVEWVHGSDLNADALETVINRLNEISPYWVRIEQFEIDMT
ncbi:hypothetical protein [Agreia sp. VKM Ac-1783]|uniref:hypothetical protein n=1 Tax=Agreia sp. VKM Ac-1783 TaxID=1938889 RepID=UPI000A2AE638|nr:hypothetical protein [Agreia sp. VKM Ac-1783]SMQ71901.1 hypothetical protein SAMN06295943_2786 [Agreia sp. VKM Ac-1783]